jgi:hypothetical protein
MKKLVFLFFSLSILSGQAQQTAAGSVEIAIRDFFSAFHARDSVALREKVSPSIHMQTIGRTASGSDSVITVPFGNFLKSIVRIPDSVRLEERLLSISVLEDGQLAQAWTPYEFWVDGKMSHCGVNAFHLVRERGTWKILHIVDTRRREGCE